MAKLIQQDQPLIINVKTESVEEPTKKNGYERTLENRY